MNTTTTQIKEYECPDCGSYAELHTSGTFQGIWSCTNTDCGASDNCTHEHTHNEDREVIISDEYDTRPEQARICNDCGSVVEDTSNDY